MHWTRARLGTTVGQALAIVLAVTLARQALAIAPAGPTYQGVERAIQEAKKPWASPGTRPATAAGWEALFDAVTGALKTYSEAGDDPARLEALERIDQLAGALGSTTWRPALTVRDAIEIWSEPRKRLAQAELGLDSTLRALPSTSDQKVKANRDRWRSFARDDLGKAIKDYEAARTVAARQAALDAIHRSLAALETRVKERPWAPSTELAAAADTLFNNPNLDIAADAKTLAPLLDRNLVDSGPVLRKGYLSEVTAGAKTGYGLVPSDDGIAFYISQYYTSVTPIWDFQNRLAADPQGRRAAKLYQFSATSIDNAEIIITTTFRTSGLDIQPAYRHGISAQVCSQPTADGGMGRAVASLVGMGQQRITNRVQEESLKDFQARIPAEAMEEGFERIAAQKDKRDAEIKARLHLSGRDITVQGVVVKSLALHSTPESAFISGVVGLQGSAGVLGADAPKPPIAGPVDPGLTAQVHLGSLLTSLAANMFEREQIRSIKNEMVIIKILPPGAPPRDAVTFQKNVDFAEYLKKVDESRDPKSKIVVLRVTRPSRPPEFRTDARGFLVALVHDLVIDVPAPPQEAKGGGLGGSPAKVYRLVMPLAELSFSFKIVPKAGGPLELTAKVEDFSPGFDSKVLAINESETNAPTLSRFSGGVILGALGGRLRSQPINLGLDQSRLPNLVVRSVSDLDPSGWIRVNLEPKSL